jgi:hypothetical protein
MQRGSEGSNSSAETVCISHAWISVVLDILKQVLVPVLLVWIDRIRRDLHFLKQSSGSFFTRVVSVAIPSKFNHCGLSYGAWSARFPVNATFRGRVRFITSWVTCLYPSTHQLRRPSRSGWLGRLQKERGRSIAQAFHGGGPASIPGQVVCDLW